MPLQHSSPILRGNIMLLAKAFARYRGIKLSTVSRMIRGDMYFLDNLAKGKIGVTDWKYDEILDYFDKNWPEGKEMPKIVEWNDASDKQPVD